MSEKWLTGRVIENRHWTDTLFSLRVEGAPLGFHAGQFLRIALDIDGPRGARARGGLAGRIAGAGTDGRGERGAGVAIAPDTSHGLLGGNPQMLKDAPAALMARGMRKHRRRAPGHITVESFW